MSQLDNDPVDNILIKDIPPQDTQQPSTPLKQPIQLLIFAILLFVALAIIAIFFFRNSSNDPIVGKWSAYVAVQSGNVIPIIDSTYIDIKRNGTFSLHLEKDSSLNGKWALYDASTNRDLGIPYTLDFEEGGTEVLFCRDEEIVAMIGNVMLCFRK